MKVVLDTNVLLSSVLTRGICEAVLDACIGSDEHTLVLSEYILREFAHQAEKKFGAPAEKVRRAVEFLRSHVELVEPAQVAVEPEKGVRTLLPERPFGCFAQKGPDPFFRLPILGTLLGAQADCLVTGDKDLLDLDTFQGKPILSPRGFAERVVSRQ